MPITIDLDKYERATREHVVNLMLDSWDRTRQDRDKGIDRTALAQRVLALTDNREWANAIEHGDKAAVAEVDIAVSGLAGRGGAWGSPEMDELYSVARGIMKLYDVLEQEESGKTYDQAEEEARSSAQELIEESRGNAQQLQADLEAAAKRIPIWNRSSVRITGSYDENLDPLSTFHVYVGGEDAGFTVFTDKQGKTDDVDDVLDVGDDYFFPPGKPELSADYFNLLRELKHPGSTQRGRTITLWTARPTKDRRLYERGKAVPPGIYLTTSDDRAWGIAHDLGSGEVRDLWRIRMNTMYLIKTLDTPGAKDFQVAGTQPVPVASMDLVMEGEARRRVAQAYLTRVANR